MKRSFSSSTQFKKDFAKLKKQGKDLGKIKLVTDCLIDGDKLPVKYKDHALKGEWKESRDCHIEPDCILIYTIESNHVHFERIGSHSELFK